MFPYRMFLANIHNLIYAVIPIYGMKLVVNDNTSMYVSSFSIRGEYLVKKNTRMWGKIDAFYFFSI
jgi:hypothetical protein